MRDRSFKLAGALRDALLKFVIQARQLSRLAIKIDEHAHLSAQHPGNDGYGHIIHGAHLVALQAIELGKVDRGDEDHRRFLEARMLADHARQLETIELWHTDIDENDRDVVF